VNGKPEQNDESKKKHQETLSPRFASVVWALLRSLKPSKCKSISILESEPTLLLIFNLFNVDGTRSKTKETNI
jgi:hypothetical protein